MHLQRAVVDVECVALVVERYQELFVGALVHPDAPILLVDSMWCARAIKVDVEAVLVHEVVNCVVADRDSSPDRSSRSWCSSLEILDRRDRACCHTVSLRLSDGAFLSRVNVDLVAVG